MSQQFILALAAYMLQYNFYLWDILQTYIQSTTYFNREFFVYLLVKLKLDNNAILKIIKPLYKVLKIENHWLNIYNSHHHKNFSWLNQFITLVCDISRIIIVDLG